MTTYCSPCIADLALVREAATTVAGTSSCMAHAVLLTHSTDDPGRRRQRLDALRELAASKAEHADPAEQASLELLVQEYGLAGAMDMGGPSRRSGQQQRPIRQGQPGSQHGQHGQQQPATGEEARRPKSRRGRPRPGERPEGAEEGRPEGAREDAREGGRRGGRVGAETASSTVTPRQDGDGPPAPAAGSDSSPSQPAPSSGSAPPPSAPAPSAPAPSAPAPSAPAPSSAPDSAPSSGAAPTEARPTTGSGGHGAVPPSSSSDA